MAIIKCKMCGGDLEIIAGSSVMECEYCGSMQTVPVADNEKKMTLFARANRLRMACDFDKAAGVYESIVAEFPEEAEAYWGLVLCKYGIEYVDDPATSKKIPTCHRSSFDSVMDDVNLEQALENADAVARKVYREEAKAIEELRKGIIEVSGKEEPYDIFICYKETAENGDRTIDSVIAQDVYDALTEKGYRVFFSRITLEDKLGQEYEPYIFAALHSAKVMLAFGTDYEYYNAVWVKNEWSRFLQLIAAGEKKTLIPCYKGIDAYDLPKEFARLQAQDMGKVGAIQDLLRGIEKIIPKAKPVTVVQERVVVGGVVGDKIASLLDRGNMALEDGDWAKADSFFEDVLNNDSKNAQAYLGKALAVEKCRTIDAFARKRKDASQDVHSETLHLEKNNTHVAKMVGKYTIAGYVDKDTIYKLYEFNLSYQSDVSARKQQYNAEKAFWENHKWLSKAEKFAIGPVAENLAKEKNALFAALSEREKTAERKQEEAAKALQQRYEQHLQAVDAQVENLYAAGMKQLEEDYQTLLQTAKTSSDVSELTDAAKKLEALGDYQDSKNLAAHCRNRAKEEQAEIDAKNEHQRLLREKEEKVQKAKKKARNTVIGIICAVVVATAVVGYVFVLKPLQSYNSAMALLNNAQYQEAAAAFASLGDYKDCRELVDKEIPYLEAMALFEKAADENNSVSSRMDFCTEAEAAFKKIGNYKESVTRVADIKELSVYLAKLEQYNEATKMMSSSKYLSAAELFLSLGDFQDSVDCMVVALDYHVAALISNSTDIVSIESVLAKPFGVAAKDCPAYVSRGVQILYDAIQYRSNRGEDKQVAEWGQALLNFTERNNLTEYLSDESFDLMTAINECKYLIGKMAIEGGKLNTAHDYLSTLPENYKEDVAAMKVAASTYKKWCATWSGANSVYSYEATTRVTFNNKWEPRISVSFTYGAGAPSWAKEYISDMKYIVDGMFSYNEYPLKNNNYARQHLQVSGKKLTYYDGGEVEDTFTLLYYDNAGPAS